MRLSTLPLTVAALIYMPHHAFNASSGAHMLRVPRELQRHLSPVLGVDAFRMPQPTFGPHPHAGMSAVTMMLPEAEAGFINRDSLGHQSHIRPGDLQWTQAGSGMLHEELPSEPGKAAMGLQIFVNLAQAHKQSAPKAFYCAREDMPSLQSDGVHVRIVSGTLGALHAPIGQHVDWLTPLLIADIRLAPNASTRLPIKAGHSATLIVLSGAARLDEVGAQALAHQAAIYAPNPQTDADIALNNTQSDDMRAVLLSGLPIPEPVYSGGPFTGNSAEDIAAYQRAFREGRMGSLAPSVV
jgi:redox-sensitive bicupin YhaK (pirin superfamily)